MAEETPAAEPAELIRAEKTALDLIARAEQCSWKLKHKLEKKKFSSEVIKTVLDRLTELGLLNDHRYAQLWLKGRINKGDKGPRLLSELLRARGINRETADSALSLSLTPEIETALLRRCLETAEKRGAVSSGKNSAETQTARRYFLRQQGFSAEAIERYCEEL